MFKTDYMEITDAKELWKLEKSRFRKIWILALVALIVPFLCFLADAIYLAVSYEKIQNWYSIMGAKPEEAQSLFSMMLLWRVVAVVLLFFMLLFYSLNISKCYKEKSFMYVGKWIFTTYSIIWFGASIDLIYSIFRVFKYLHTDGLSSYRIYTGLQVIYVILMIILAFLFMRNMKNVVFAFNRAYWLEMQAKAAQELFKNLNDDQVDAINSLFGVNLEKKNPNEEEAIIVTSQKEKEEQKEAAKRKRNLEKLLSLPNEQLFQAAEKLNIRGYEHMEKEKLANLILDIVDMNSKRKESQKDDESKSNDDKKDDEKKDSNDKK